MEPAVIIKKMFFIHKKSVALYKTKKYIESGVNCEFVTFTLDSIQLSHVKDLSTRDTCRKIRRKLLEESGKLYEKCLNKLAVHLETNQTKPRAEGGL